MVFVSGTLTDQKVALFRLLRGILLGLAVFLAVDRGGDAVLRHGIDRYFGLQTADAVLLVGHSHVELGLDRVRLERLLGVSVSKYARAGAQLEDRILMVRHYAARHPSGPRAIVFGVDGHLFTPRGLSSNAHLLFYPHLDDDPLIADHLSARARDWQEHALRRLVHLARYNDVLINSARRGLSGDWSSGVRGRFDPDRLAREAALGTTRPLGIDPDQVARFQGFLDEAEARGWPVILTFVPTTAAWDALEPGKFAQVLDLLHGFVGRHENVTFLDMRDPWSTQDHLFADPVHLNINGQRQVTDDLARRLASLLLEGN